MPALIGRGLAAAILTAVAGIAQAAAPCIELGLEVPRTEHFRALEGNDFRAVVCAGVLQRVTGRSFGETYRDHEAFSFRRGDVHRVRIRHVRYHGTFGPIAGISTQVFVFSSGRLVHERPTERQRVRQGESPGRASEYLAAGRDLRALARTAAAKCLGADGRRRPEEVSSVDCVAPR